MVLDATGADASAMAAVAAEVGYSETAFLVARPDGEGEFDVRYFSPLVEVPFCGHATIATAVAYAQQHGVGDLTFHTAAGPVRVGTSVNSSGQITAQLVSVPPRVEPISPEDLDQLLTPLRWSAADLDSSLPPRAAYAGAWHPVIAVSTRARLADLHYDMPALGTLMKRRDWATVNLVWRESETVFHARNPFPPGGVVEDPATGAAAAALGGYLRDLGLVDVPAQITVHQGEDMGRPSIIHVRIPEDRDGGITISGTAVPK